jgi:chromosome segregation ATPase
LVGETEKKGIGWFKGVRSNQNQLEKNSAEQPEDVPNMVVEESSITPKESEQPVGDSNRHLFSKGNQDKITLDVVISIENMIKERQLLSYKNKGLEDQLYTANETINRFKHDQIKKDQLIQEKNKEIRELENNLTNKQMSYDQLLEDYKEYQHTSNMEYEKLSNQLETETAKYANLYEESTNTQYQSMLKISELEDKIRSLEIANQKYAEQYQKIVDEKADLMQTINDFAERMSFSFSPTKGASSNPSESK